MSSTLRIVGRDRELRIFKGLLLDLKQGSGSFCMIRGRSGTGKTRLASGFLAAAAKEGITVLSSSGEQTERTPYSAVRSVMEQYRALLKDYPQKKRQEAVDFIMKGLDKTAPLIASLDPELSSYFDTGGNVSLYDDESEKGRFASVFASFLIYLSRFEKGAVVFFDDLGSVDHGSLEMIIRAASAVSAAPLIIIAAAREHAPDAALFEFSSLCDALPREDFSDFAVGPLDQDSHASLVKELLPSASDIAAAASFIYARSGGLPFLAVEITRRLVSQGFLLIDGGKASIREGALDQFGSEDSFSAEIPSVFSEREKLFLSCASVLGSSFYPDRVCEYFPDDLRFSSREAEAACEKGTESGVLSRDRYGAYRFSGASHLLFYGAVESGRRMVLHASIAAFIESHMKEISDALFSLAWHYVRSGNEPKGIEYSFAAGLDAMSRFAYDDAMTHLSWCLKALENKNDSASVRMRLESAQGISQVYIGRGRYHDAADVLTPLIKGEGVKYYSLYKQQSFAFYKMGDFDSAEKCASAGLSLLGDHLPSSWAGALFGTVLEAVKYSLSRLLPYRGAAGENEKKYRAKASFYTTLCRGYAMHDIPKFLFSVMKARSITDRKLRGKAEQGISATIHAVMFLSIRWFRRAEKEFHRALMLFESLRDEWGISQTYLSMGFSRIWQARFEEARQFLERSASGFGSIGATGDRCAALLPLFDSWYMRAEYDEAEKIADEIEHLSAQTHDGFSAGIAAHNRMLVAIERGRFPDAERFCRISLSEAFKRKDPYRRCIALVGQGYLFYMKGSFDAAVHSLREAEAIRLENSFIGHYTANLLPLLLLSSLKAADPLSKVNIASLSRRVEKAADHWTAYSSLAYRAAALSRSGCGDDKAALSLLLKGRAAAEKAGRPGEKAACEAELGRLYRALGRSDEAYPCMENAYFFFLRSGSYLFASEILREMESVPGADERVNVLLSSRRYEALISYEKKAASFQGEDLLPRETLAFLQGWFCAQGGILFGPAAGEKECPSLAGSGSADAELFLKSCKRGELIVEELNGIVSLSIPVISDELVTGGVVLSGLPLRIYDAGDSLFVSSVLSRMDAALDSMRSSRAVIEGISSKKDLLPSANEDKLRDVISYIKENYRDEISRDVLADRVDLNPDYLGKIFKVYTGSRIADFINEMRISEAKRLLLEEKDLSIVDIAFSVGFESLRTFNRSFSAISGLTPSAYRDGKEVKYGQMQTLLKKAGDS